MIIVVIILIVLAIWLSVFASDEDYVGTSLLSATGAVIFGITALIMVWIIIDGYCTGYVAKDKIKMYQEENTNIESEIDVLVKQYMSYESNTYKEFKSESSITLVNLFPDLKSSELVSRQLQIYLDNNNKIKALKEDLIDFKIAKWLLYFGGK